MRGSLYPDPQPAGAPHYAPAIRFSLSLAPRGFACAGRLFGSNA